MTRPSVEQVRRVVLAILVVAAVAVSAWVVQRWAATGDYDTRLAAAMGRLEPDAQPAEGKGEGEGEAEGKKPATPEPNKAATAAADRIEKSYIYIPKPPPQYRNVEGVLGDRVIFAGGRSVGIGETFDGAKIIAIGSDWVDLEVDGKTISIGVFGGEGSRGTSQQ